MLLVGCFTVPSTYTRQANGKPRPESLIGERDGIVLGETQLEDALIAIAQRTSGTTPGNSSFNLNASRADPVDWTTWLLADDSRRVAVRYNLRTGTVIWPLCFQAFADFHERLLVLETDDAGVVVRSRTIDRSAAEYRDFRPVRFDPQRLIDVFPEPMRRRLAAAGTMPDDATLRGLASQVAAQRSRRPATVPVLPATTRAAGDD